MDQLSHFLTQGHCLLVLVNDLVTRWLASTQAPSPTKLRFTWLNGHQTNELGSAYFQPCPTMASNWLRRVLALSNLSSPPKKKLTIFCGTHIISVDSMVMSCLTSQKTKKLLIKSFLTWDHIFFQTKQQFKTIYLYRKETKQNTSGWLPLHNCWSWNHSKTVSKFTNQLTT